MSGNPDSRRSDGATSIMYSAVWGGHADEVKTLSFEREPVVVGKRAVTTRWNTRRKLLHGGETYGVMALLKQRVATMAALMDPAVIDTGGSLFSAAHGRVEASMKFLLQHQHQPHG